MAKYPTAECSSCHAPVVWAVTRAAKRIPLDADPVPALTSGGGNIVLAPGSPSPLATVVSNPALLFGKTVYRSHFSTCPYAERHRHPRSRRGPS